MGKSKKKKGVKKEPKSRAGVDDRVKKVLAYEAEDADEYKMDNEKNIDNFYRYNKKRPYKGSIKDESRKKFT